MTYIRPTSSVVYHVVTNMDPAAFLLGARCGRTVPLDRIGDRRESRPARVCVGCDREDISAT